MPQEPRAFILKTAMYGYASNDRRTGYQLAPHRLYTATYVGKNHLIVMHPERVGVELAVPLKSPWWWQRVELEPEVCGLAALFNQPRPSE